MHLLTLQELIRLRSSSHTQSPSIGSSGFAVFCPSCTVDRKMPKINHWCGHHREIRKSVGWMTATPTWLLPDSQERPNTLLSGSRNRIVSRENRPALVRGAADWLFPLKAWALPSVVWRSESLLPRSSDSIYDVQHLESSLSTETDH